MLEITDCVAEKRMSSRKLLWRLRVVKSPLSIFLRLQTLQKSDIQVLSMIADWIRSHTKMVPCCQGPSISTASLMIV